MIVIFFFVLSEAGIVAAIVYGLFRIAIFDKGVYSWFFLAVSSVLFFYLMYRIVRKKLLSKILLQIAWILFLTCFVAALVAVALLYGSLFVRIPLVGFISVPFVIFLFFFLLPKLKVISTMKKYFS
jgi:hypothetical protein